MTTFKLIKAIRDKLLQIVVGSCDDEYECPHYRENIAMSERDAPLELSIRWNKVGLVVDPQSMGIRNDLKQIMKNTNREISPSLWIKNISNQPINRIQVEGAYDGSTFFASMPNKVPVLESGDEIELDPFTLEFDIIDGMVLKVKWHGGKDEGFRTVVDLKMLDAPLVDLPLAIFLKDGTFSGKVLPIYNGSKKQLRNSPFVRWMSANYPNNRKSKIRCLGSILFGIFILFIYNKYDGNDLFLLWFDISMTLFIVGYTFYLIQKIKIK